MKNNLKGFWFPPEWYPHHATWLSWPHNQLTWPNDINKIYPSYAQFIKTIAQGELVCINVVDRKMRMEAKEVLGDFGVNLKQIRWYPHPTDDAWIRDHGPSFLVNHQSKQQLLLHWGYNAWGDKYPPYDQDATIPKHIAKALNIRRISPGIIMEGGSLDFNGKGAVLTTKSCLLNPNRNPQCSQADIAQMLKRYYNLNQIIWLGDGIAGDDTDGHVDDLTRFVDEDRVITMVDSDQEDVNHLPLKQNLQMLQSVRLTNGQPLEIVPIQLPKPLYWKEQRLPASYANFYICNAAVIVPTFNDPQDQQALKAIANCFKDRPTIGIDSTHLIGGLGSFHCLSQQQPVWDP